MLNHVCIGLRAAFRTAERISNPFPFECRLSPSTQYYRAPAANFRSPPVAAIRAACSISHIGLEPPFAAMTINVRNGALSGLLAPR
jgi:hypothetical protein